MIYCSNTQKLLQREKPCLGSRDAQEARGGDEAKETLLTLHSPEGPQPAPCWATLTTTTTFANAIESCNGSVWKEVEVYNWLWGPQLCSENLLPVVGVLPKPGVQIPSQPDVGSRRLALDSDQAPHIFMSEETWHESKNSACLCLLTECYLEANADLSEELSGFLIFWL